MRILVTGGAGFIGSHVVRHFQGRAQVRVLDNLRSGNRANLEGLDHEFIEGTVEDRDLVRLATRGIDYIFHFAALASVPESVENPKACHQINVEGLGNVLDAAASSGVRKLCLSSSAAVYGDNPSVPKIETMPPEPRSPYAQSKLDGEFLCDCFTQDNRLETVCLRFFNVFGPRQNPRSSYAAAVPIFIEHALANEPLVIHGDGGQTRDFIPVSDVVDAAVFATTTQGITGVFNVGLGRSISINDLASMIIAAADSRSAIEHAPNRPGDVRHSLASIGKLREAGFTPSGDFEEAIRETVRFVRESKK